MKTLLMLILLIKVLALPVGAVEFTAPTVPEGAQEYMPEQYSGFGDGIMQIIKTAVSKIQPELASAAGICLKLSAVNIILSIVQSFAGDNKKTVHLTGAVIISILLLQPSKALIHLGAETVTSVSEYGKLLLPVMTAAMAAQGFAKTSAALYTATAVFSAVMSELISRFIIPVLYIYICISIADSAVSTEILQRIKKFLKWAMTWALKTILYIFTGYISITGAISGSADASIVKATRLTISGMVPVVGNLLADASETIVISAGVMKNAAGVLGLFAVAAICIGPFLQIGVQYLLLKLTAGICSIFGAKHAVKLMDDFCVVMGHLLAMTGTVCILLLVSVVCYMRGTA